MKNKLFDFNFVDRSKERKIISDFINQKTDSNILWINGQSGVGKSFLIENTLMINDTSKRILISPQAQGQTESSLGLFIKEIQNATGVNLLTFIKNNYSSISDIAKKVINVILAYKKIDIEWFLDIAFDSSKLFISNNDEKQNTSKLLQKYIEEIIQQDSLMIILDNFTYCDYESQQIFLDLILLYKNDCRIQFVVSTTHEKLEEQKYLKKVLLEKIDTEYLFLSGFNDAQFFKKIFEKKFVLTSELSDLIPYVFKICNGIPESLKEVLRNLALSNSIEQTDLNGKLTINVDDLKNYLLNYDNELPQIDFNLFNDIECFFLQVVTYIKYPISITVLKRIYDYLYRKIFCVKNREIVPSYETLINKFIGIDVLQCKKENKISIISFKHDLLYWKLNEQFLNYVNKDTVFYYLYRYFSENQKFLQDNDISKSKSYEMMAYYSYRADVDEWIDLNYNLGKYKYDLALFYDATNVFERLSPKIHLLTEDQKIIIAKCFYDAGQYNECILTLKSVDVENIQEKCELYFLWGKALFVKLNALEAIEKLDLAEKHASPNKQEYYNILAMKLVALAESPKGDASARELFELEIKPITEDVLYEKFLGNILRNCWAYCTGTEAIHYLNIALAISQKTNNDIEIAYTYNNLGLEYARNWELEKAVDAYNKALTLLNNTKHHETSYPLNNLAACEMLKRNYQTALDYLLEAILWNKAPFMDKVIKTHMLMCNYYLNNTKQCQIYATELSEYLFHNTIQNENIIRRISLNLCIYYRNIGEKENAKKCILLASKYIKNSKCEYRGTVLYNELMNTNKPLDIIQYNSTFYREMTFDPWITAFSHE